MSNPNCESKKKSESDSSSEAVTDRNIQTELENKSREIFELQVQLDIIYNSISWRVTKPIRFCGRLVRGWKNSIFANVQRGKFLFFAGARSLLRLDFMPAKIKYSLFEFLSRIRSRVFLPHNTESNRKMMMFLARERSMELTNKVFDQILELPEITISVVTYNNGKWIERFMESLASQEYPLSKIALVFVDHQSTDQTLQVIEKITEKYSRRFSSVEILSQANLGFGAGHDLVIRNALTNFVLVSNVDLQFEAKAIKSLVENALNDHCNTASWECRQKPYEHPKYYDPVTLETSWSSHACVLIKKESYLNVGGYEKKIFMYGEDVELSYRFRDHGFSVKYVPDAVVWHHTYEHEGQVKTQQLVGSTLANAYVRLRYGNITDILSIFGLYLLLIMVGPPISYGRLLMFKNFGKILLNSPYFLSSRKKSSLSFPFRAWDYERQREGAFYSCKQMPDRSPKVSVVIRTYEGRRRWLQEAVVSVINQTYKHIELVIVEDGSDSLAGFVDDLRSRLPAGMHVTYSAQPKRGRSYNGNAGLRIATGQYAIFLDDDDLFFPDHIETLVVEIMQRDHVDAVYSLSWEVETEKVDGVCSFYEERSHTMNPCYKQVFSREVLLHHNYMPIQSVLFRRSLFDEFGGFDVELDALEDWVLWIKYSSRQPFHYVEKMTSLFRTPYDMDLRAARHEVLHRAYPEAKLIQKQFFEKLKENDLEVAHNIEEQA